MNRFDGKVALLTGAGSGIGRATTLRLLAEGASVLAVDINAESLSETVALAGIDANVQSHIADVSDPTACQGAVGECLARFGRLDVLGNIAGVVLMAHFTEMTVEQYQRIMRINVDGPLYMAQAAIPHLLQRDGNIVNIASNAGLMGMAYNVAYSMSKGAIVQLTRSLAMEAMEEAERAVMLADFAKPTLMDGLLERRLATAPTHNVPIVGLVKRQMTTYLPAGLQEMVYALKPGERTPAFVLRTVQHVDLVNTYVRLSSEAGISPSYGIVRVTAPLAYVESAHAHDMPQYLSGLAAYLYRLRHRDLAYSRAGISVDPIVRVEDHLHAILPNLDALIPRLHRMFRQPGSDV